MMTALVLAAVTAHAPRQIAPARPTPSVARTRTVQTDDIMKETLVRLHNQERTRVGTAPVEWDETLAADAAGWAEHLAQIDVLRHADNSADNAEGENLWLGTRGAWSVDEMVGGWSEEKVQLRRMRSWEEDYHAVGHYTQMVWSTTRKIGCAIRSSRTNDVLVCRYWPAGNVLGAQPYAAQIASR